MRYQVDHLLPVGNIIGESPLWVPEEQALYWTDTERNAVWSRAEKGGPGADPAGGGTGFLRRWTLGLPVTSILRREGEGFLLVTKEGIAFWDAETNLCELIANPTAGRPDIAFNDGAVDRQGRLLTGTMNFRELTAPDGCLYRVDPDLTVHLLDSGLSVANGIGVSPDGRTVYVSEQFKGRILAYDYDPDAGTLSGRREFARLPEAEGLPDGIITDAEGFVWNAHWGGGRITRYAPDGTKDLQILMPVPIVACLAFGGAELSDLYVTTGRYGMSEADRKEHPGSGDLFRIRTGFTGLREPRFRWNPAGMTAKKERTA